MNLPPEAILARPARSAALALLQSAGLPVADLTDAHMEHFFFLGSPQMPIGVVGLEFCGRDALLRSLAVVEAHRGSGLGAALTTHAERHARARGARAVYLLTTSAATFFKRHGFAVAERSTAPAAIRATREFADICPASSVLLVKSL